MSWFISSLINDNRLERLPGHRPFRVRILDHPKNRAAIRRLEKALEAADRLAAQTKTEAPAQVAVEQKSPPAPEPPAALPPAALPYPKPRTLFEAEQNLRSVGVDPSTAQGKDVITLPTVKTAPTGMLLEELLNRGYTVSKNR
jgi:hypothetical protein